VNTSVEVDIEVVAACVQDMALVEVLSTMFEVARIAAQKVVSPLVRVHPKFVVIERLHVYANLDLVVVDNPPVKACTAVEALAVVAYLVLNTWLAADAWPVADA